MQPLRAVRSGALAWLASTLTMTGAAAQDDPARVGAQLPASVFRLVEQSAVDLKTADRTAEVGEVVALLGRLGRSESALAVLHKRLERTKVRERDSQRAVVRACRNLQQAAAGLSRELTKLEEPERSRLARVLLGIDDDQAAAREALGYRKVAARWLDAAGEHRRARRIEILDRLRQARQLDVPITVTAAELPVLEHVYGDGGKLYAWHGLRMYTCVPEHRARRLLQNLVRVLALSRWLIDGRFELPEKVEHTNVLFDNEPDFKRAVAFDRANGKMKLSDEELGTLAGYYRDDFVFVHHRTMETNALAGLFCHVASVVNDNLHDRPEQPCLIVGHTNWLLMAFAGAEMPSIQWRETESAGAEGTSASERDERQSVRLLASAGLMGVKAWLRYRAARGEDPPWSRSFADRVGKVDGEDLLKSTVVAEFLHEEGRLGAMLAATRAAVGKPPAEVIAAMEAGLGIGLHDFEAQWRDWLLDAAPTSLLRRLGAPAAATETAAGAAARRLDELRHLALTDPRLGELPDLVVEAELGDQALAHVRYLALHPDQAATWPDVHEEFTDREGFTPEGAWAGNHSVIVSGVRDPAAAIDVWMGTFYHRLPLLDPGLLRIGWGHEGTTAVLDAGSMVRVMEWHWQVVWPADGMRDVPLRFCGPELPHPVPGEDQDGWGYPITLQLGAHHDRGFPRIVEMTLHQGDAAGPIVPCHLSTPEQPTNPRLVPEGTGCLIPRQPLKSGSRYTVSVRLQGADDDALVWSFTTK